MNSEEKIFNVLIIGAGKIAGGYDWPDDESVITHANAFHKNEKFNLVGFYDINYEIAQKMAQKWYCKAFKSLNEVEDIDVICICSPNECHLQNVKEALALNPKLIFLEKPAAGTRHDEAQIIELSKKVPILTNYIRRFVHEFEDLNDKIKSGQFGEFLTGNGFYGKGFFHNGFHMIDLLDFLFGKIKKIDTIDEFADFFPEDKTKTAMITFLNDKKFFLQGISWKNYNIFELDLFFEKARIRILNNGFEIEIYKVFGSKELVEYRSLVLNEKLGVTLDFAMKNAVWNIYNHLTRNEPLKSPVITYQIDM